MRNVLITGSPRSGTTLVCSLLNNLPDVVALHEPMNVWDFANCRDHDEIVKTINDFCFEMRKSLHQDGVAISKHVGGTIPDNFTTGERSRAGMRLRKKEHGRVRIDKPLSENFTLAIKHPGAFSALLQTLTKRFECFAIVRNPLATLGSWNSLAAFPLKDGHAPIVEKLDVDLARELASESDAIERQIRILEWFYDQFRRFLSDRAVIKYENLVASKGRELAKIFPAAADLDEDLRSKNLSQLYGRALMNELAERLVKREGPIWNFYSKTEITNLFNQLSSNTAAQV